LGRRDLVALNSAVAASASRLNGRLNSLTRAALREHPDLPNVHLTPPGQEGLRREVAKRMALTGLRVTADDVIVTNGTMEAIALSLGALCRRGDTVLVESPTYFGVLQVLEHLGLNIVEVPNDAEAGIDVQALEYVLAGTKVAAAVLQSSFNNPAGSATPDAAKRRIVQALASRGIPLVEDDIYGDLHFGRSRPFVAKKWDASGNVLLCGSFTKSVAPGFRIGWIAPGRYRRDVELLKFITSITTPELPQLAIAEFIDNGGYDHHLRKLRAAFVKQVEQMSEAVAEHFPAQCRVTQPAGGFVLWVELPPEVDSVRLFEAARAHGIAIAPGTMFTHTGRYRNFIRLNCGHPMTTKLELAVERLGELVKTGARL
jgi:DNA-binding transcriptional MocR family regulator